MTAPWTDRQCGAALLTVLLMLSVISAVAVAMLDDIRFAVRRTANTQIHDQAQWYALGAEEFARQILARMPQEKLRRALATAENGTVIRQFDIEGGMIRAAVSDGSNCFNLNSVVTAEGGTGFAPRPRGIQEFRRLLTALEFSESEAGELAAALTDWIDSDTQPRPRGAEDYAYTDREPAYRTGNTLIADVSELRAMRGYDAEIVSRLRPFICARANADLTVLNINTLRRDEAPLLAMLFGGELSAFDARSLIAERPEGGYRNMEAFWAQKILADLEVGEAVRDRIGLDSRYYRLEAQVRYEDARTGLIAVFEKEGAELRRISRRFGAAL